MASKHTTKSKPEMPGTRREEGGPLTLSGLSVLPEEFDSNQFCIKPKHRLGCYTLSKVPGQGFWRQLFPVRDEEHKCQIILSKNLKTGL